MKITIVSKNPPGGRCTLYMRYAEAIAEMCAVEIETVFPTTESEIDPPALLVDGHPITPADGLILSPLDIHSGLAGMGGLEVLTRLEDVELRFMNDCGA